MTKRKNPPPAGIDVESVIMEEMLKCDLKELEEALDQHATSNGPVFVSHERLTRVLAYVRHLQKEGTSG